MQWTGLYAAALTLVFLVLSRRVIRLRGRLQQGIGAAHAVYRTVA